MVEYKANGIVLGNCWGGGVGAYDANEMEATNRASLVKHIENGIENSLLDGGMGFQSLIGAIMIIETIDSRIIDGKEFIACDYESEFFGDLSEEQKEALLDLESYR